MSLSHPNFAIFAVTKADAMQLFYQPDIADGTVTLDQEESRHASRVLRLSCGDTLHVTDGHGSLMTCSITRTSPLVTASVVSVERDWHARPYSLTLAVAPTKNTDRFEWFLEKATEAGVDRIIPVECDRSERRVLRTDRLVRILVSAMKQSNSALLPVLEPLTSLDEVLGAATQQVRLIAHCDPGFGRVFIGEALPARSEAIVLIGPEGDFSPREIALAERCGFSGVSLGMSRYRTESAAVSVAMTDSFINSFNNR